MVLPVNNNCYCKTKEEANSFEEDKNIYFFSFKNLAALL
jgi:hypothetical protein